MKLDPLDLRLWRRQINEIDHYFNHRFVRKLIIAEHLPRMGAGKSSAQKDKMSESKCQNPEGNRYPEEEERKSHPARKLNQSVIHFLPIRMMMTTKTTRRR